MKRRRRPSRGYELPKLLALAPHKNIVCEDQRCLQLSHEKFPTRNLGSLGASSIRSTLDRCMWGTDWTRAVALLTYKDGRRVLPRHGIGLSRQRPRHLMGGLSHQNLRLGPRKKVGASPKRRGALHAAARTLGVATAAAVLKGWETAGRDDEASADKSRGGDGGRHALEFFDFVNYFVLAVSDRPDLLPVVE